ncbi:CRISPR-associated protein [Rhodothermus profundi]|uniref:CRISPR-associated protein, TIGR02710 family n=1 Tax=Rhodothermus profundi TaxID=633813 RepID=A0A1M6XVJ8_9BACT|nr:CRISPR-associated protein [Rhodothermus profundi]SHL09845.1 CRISPR-associated protein, TIGR02710 family [Rhodothermus profundi]
MKVRFLLIRLPFQRSMLLVAQEVEGQWIGAYPVLAPGEVFYDDQALQIVREIDAGRLPGGAQEMGVFEFPDLDAMQEAARAFAQDLKESFWGEETELDTTEPIQVDTVMLLTVGGSPEPLIHAVQHLPPDRSFVCFICSPESRVLVEGDEATDPSIPKAARLESSRYEVTIWKDPDDLTQCVASLFALQRRIRKRFPGARVVANYTGGTKTMSAALVIGAVLLGWELQLNVGVRQDLRQVLAGTDVPTRVAADDVLLHLQLQLVREVLDRFDYGAAAAIVRELLHTLSLGGTHRAQLLRLYQIVKGLADWDRCRYRQALTGFRMAGEQGSAWLPLLNRLAEQQMMSWEGVGDLLLNARRRAHQGRYEEAAVRLYRAMTLLAAVQLREAHGLEAGDPDLERVPASLRSLFALRRSETDRLPLDPIITYRLLEELGDPVGALFARRPAVRKALEACQQSCLLEGDRTLDASAYETLRSRLEGFVREAAQRIEVRLPTRQLPGAEVLEWVELAP